MWRKRLLEFLYGPSTFEASPSLDVDVDGRGKGEEKDERDSLPREDATGARLRELGQQDLKNN